MNVESVKLKAAVVFFSIVFLLAAGSASAQTQPPIRITSISVPSTISHPLDGFTINFTLTGAKYGGLGAGLIGVDFYVSDTPSGSNGVYPLLSKTVHLNGSGYGPYTPPAGTLSAYVTPSGMDPNTVALLQSIVTGCQPQGWYILGYVWSTSLVSAWTTKGPPYATSKEFTDAFREETPPEYAYLIEDLFETITLYDNRAVGAKITARLS
ncbi:MAG: hypothetical protein EOP84_27480 [Verrucomicrobiaceae bacterium]|nr:MAG: hypothetical protein EOP84_27480 [Verrucomicrobiaceae bacterium]